MTDRDRERFWAKVDRRGPDECWEWQGATIRGYGAWAPGEGQERYAHREAFRQANGEVPAGMSVLHHCDNPACVNPRHLFAGTQNDNMQDAKTKGRGSNPVLRGVANARSKLTEDEVLAIVAEVKAGATVEAVARKYGIGRAAASHIVNGRNWGWLTGL